MDESAPVFFLVDLFCWCSRCRQSIYFDLVSKLIEVSTYEVQGYLTLLARRAKLIRYPIHL